MYYQRRNDSSTSQRRQLSDRGYNAISPNHIRPFRPPKSASFDQEDFVLIGERDPPNRYRAVSINFEVPWNTSRNKPDSFQPQHCRRTFRPIPLDKQPSFLEIEHLQRLGGRSGVAAPGQQASQRYQDA